MAVADVRQLTFAASCTPFRLARRPGSAKTKTGRTVHVTGGSRHRVPHRRASGGIFSYAVRQGLRADNPVRGLERPADGRRTAFLTMDDYRALGAALRLRSARAKTLSRFMRCGCWR